MPRGSARESEGLKCVELLGGSRNFFYFLRRHYIPSFPFASIDRLFLKLCIQHCVQASD